MPCCHLPPGPAGNFLTSLQDDAQQFAIYVGGGTPTGRVLLPRFLTSALHMEMKLWKPTPFTYWENDAQRNSWAVMRVVLGKDTFVDREKCEIFNLLCKLPAYSTPSGCVLNQYDGWLLDMILNLRGLGLAPHRGPIPAGTARHVSALASVGRAQKLLNIFLKYELCWQVAGQWAGGNVLPYASPRIPDLQRFLCALHAPLDSIILEAITGLPLGRWLQEQGLQKKSNDYLQQSSNGNFVPWSKLDCLRTYYGLQLILRRIAMATWPTGCICGASPDKVIEECCDWFNCKYPRPEVGRQDWLKAACTLPKEVIDATLGAMKIQARDASGADAASAC